MVQLVRFRPDHISQDKNKSPFYKKQVCVCVYAWMSACVTCVHVCVYMYLYSIFLQDLVQLGWTYHFQDQSMSMVFQSMLTLLL